MTTLPIHALVVGDRFISADLFEEALRGAALERGLPLSIERLQLPYPAVNAVPLPTAAPSSPFRPLWEEPSEVVARADADLAADPTIREYTGSVDLLREHLPEVEALVLHLAPLSRAAVAGAARLRVVGCARGGAVNLNLPALNERGIPVFFCPGRNARAVAEFVMGAVLALSRGIVAGAAGLAAGSWRLDLYAYDQAGHELHGRTCGLVGFGAVGQALAPIVRGFGLRLLVHDPFVDDATIRGTDAERVPLDTLLRSSDIVVLAARLTDESRGMIGARELALLRIESIFVNTARAELVDGAALRDVLARRAIAGAVVDVFSPEPPVTGDHLLDHPNVLLTPHIAGATREAARRGAEVVCLNLVRFLADGSLDGSLNREAVVAASVAADGGVG